MLLQHQRGLSAQPWTVGWFWIQSHEDCVVYLMEKLMVVKDITYDAPVKYHGYVSGGIKRVWVGGGLLAPGRAGPLFHPMCSKARNGVGEGGGVSAPSRRHLAKLQEASCALELMTSSTHRPDRNSRSSNARLQHQLPRRVHQRQHYRGAAVFHGSRGPRSNVGGRRRYVVCPHQCQPT